MRCARDRLQFVGGGAALCAQRVGDPEITEFHTYATIRGAAASEAQEVFRFQIPVNDAPSVRIGECIEDLHEYPTRVLPTAYRHRVSDRPPIGEFHHDERFSLAQSIFSRIVAHPVDFTIFEQVDDTGMEKAGMGLDLSVKSSACLGSGASSDDLDGDREVVVRVAAAEYHAHSTLTDPFAHLECAELSSIVHLSPTKTAR